MQYLDKTNSLIPVVRRIVCEKATEYPHTGNYNEVRSQGTYLCRRCGIALFRAQHQFASGCGWPSFDEDIVQAVKQQPDKDGHRTEILCGRCDAHLGHVFVGEQLTPNNLRHCVNSASLDFVPDNKVLDTEEAIVGGGCFWGVDFLLNQFPGVVKTESGYCGGEIPNPNYQLVCSGNSGYYEVVRVVLDKEKTDYSSIIKRFFEIHDPTQVAGQGPDLGHQYQSVIFYYNPEQKAIIDFWLKRLLEKGYKPATKVLPIQTFWKAEEYHQDYYHKHQKAPYCHRPEARFD